MMLRSLHEAASAKASLPSPEMRWHKRVVSRGLSKIDARQFSSGFWFVTDFMSNDRRHLTSLRDPGSNGKFEWDAVDRGNKVKRAQGMACPVRSDEGTSMPEATSGAKTDRKRSLISLRIRQRVR